MDKRIYKAVADRAGGLCELCLEYKPLQLHHIISGSGKRKQHETVESCIMLCVDCHRAAHNDFRVNRLLKKTVQLVYLCEGYTIDQVRRMMGGKLY